MNLANEGLEAKRKEEEAAAKKRKAEEDALWERAQLLTVPAGAIHDVFILRKPRQESGGMALIHKRWRTKEEKEKGGRSRLSFSVTSRPV
jgi:hypothetical protein